MYDQRLMDRCISLAKSNPIQSRGHNTMSKMAALITDGGIINQVGLNKYKSHPMMYRFSKDHTKIYLHAEIDALIKFTQYFGYQMNLSKLDVYVARVLKDGTPALAKPCKTCLGALTYFGIRNIYWTKQ